MINDGVNTLVYDAEGRLLSNASGSGSGASVYDGNSLRVKRCIPNCTSPTSRTVYIFAGSKVIAEYDNGAAVTSPSREYIYSGAQLIATISGGATTYHHPDHLSVRLSTDSIGNTARTFGHFPFGEVWYETGTASKWKFTSYERDSESGNDYATARFYINRSGRFSSPDPLAGSAANPQSLNRYTYTTNDPANLVDPLGLWLSTCQLLGTCVSPDDGDLFGGTGLGQAIHAPVLDQTYGDSGLALVKAIWASTPQPAQPPGYEQCIMEALQEVIAAGEVPGEPNNGYGTLVRGKVISGPYPLNIFVGQRNLQLDPSYLSGHPGFLVNVGGGLKSTAFGRYQILAETASNYGFADFSPRGQDAAAEVLMQSRGMVVPAMQGNFSLAMKRGGLEWASLPTSPYGQPTMSMAEALAVFQNAINTLPDCQ